ncbi:glycerol-3-phosphate dehydrogenase/oxidase [Desulfothermus okinawensis JCM 13304]
MWYGYKREDQIQGLDNYFDIIVIGGGITGAGIFKEATDMGYKCLLVERNDFASGTSSASSKMVHGGLRYLKEGDIKLTFESVKERELILSQAKYLVDPMTYILPIYKDKRAVKHLIPLFLKIYDLFSIISNWHDRKINFKTEKLNTQSIIKEVPDIKKEDLIGGAKFEDSVTDDSRLVLAVIREGLCNGGIAINYLEAISFLKDNMNKIIGVALKDKLGGKEFEVKAKSVVCATGVWTKEITDMAGIKLNLRPLRGSHIIVPKEKLNLSVCVTGFHPWDGRPVFAFPWEGVTVIGTTDIDHQGELSRPPKMDGAEFEYLMDWVNFMFPSLDIDVPDIISSYSGVRPIVSAGKKLPSKEPRKHTIIEKNGLILVVGGKLTTFRKIAIDTLRYVRKCLPSPGSYNNFNHILTRFPWHPDCNLDEKVIFKLLGRYGFDSPNFFKELREKEQKILYDHRIVGEIRWSVRHEAVVHLDDLMIRRSRLGLVKRDGGIEYFPLIKPIVQEELGWDQDRWEQEKERYIKIWRQYYYLPIN